MTDMMANVFGDKAEETKEKKPAYFVPLNIKKTDRERLHALKEKLGIKRDYELVHLMLEAAEKQIHLNELIESDKANQAKGGPI
jgi:hypothetical protein